MEDRLLELQSAGGVKIDKKKNNNKNEKITPTASKQSSEKRNNNNNEIEMVEIDINEFMPEFYQQVGLIKTTMLELKKTIKSLEDKYILSLNTINIEQGSKYEIDLQVIIEETTKVFTDLKKKLDIMKENNEKQSNIETKSQSHTTEMHIRSNMHKTLLHRFIEIMREFQEVQTNYRNKYKEKIERQYQIVKPNATQEEIRVAMESGDSSAIFSSYILANNNVQQSKIELAYIQDRHNDIKRLEISISELHKLFQEMSILVDTQGEMLHSIEINTQSTLQNVKSGNENLSKALIMLKKSRTKMFILLGIVVVILIVILVPILKQFL